MALHYYELPNGLRVVFQPVKSSRVVHAALTIGAGTRHEFAEEQGLAHFIEHALFKGTKRKKAIEVISALDAVGGELNAYTTKEETCVYASFDVDFTDKALDLISDVVFHSVFPQKELNKEKTVIIDEIQSYLDSPSERIFDEFEENLFQKHSLGHNILGTEKSVRGFTAKHIRKFVERNYRTDKMVLSISGNIALSKVQSLAKKYFSHRIKNSGEIKITAPQANKLFRKRDKCDTFQDHFLIGRRAYSAYDKKRPALILLNNILGGNAMNSRLNIALREKNGFAYQVESSYTPYSDTGIFSIYFGTDHKNLAKCESLVSAELKKFRNAKLDAKNLEAAKVQLKGQVLLSEEHRVNKTLSYGKSLLVYDKIHSVKEIFKRIDAISAQNIRDCANELFDESKLNHLIYLS